MRIFLPPLEIGDTEGFSKEKDIFGRAELGLGLTNLLTNISEPIVLALDGQWGSGKTTFLRMWAGELRKTGFPVVYFDAFRSDYGDDAFTAVAAEIVALAEERRKLESGQAKAFIEKAVGAGKVILRSGLKIGIKAGTMGILNAADIENAAADISKETSDLEDKYLGELLTKQKKESDAIEAFQEALQELPILLSSATKDEPRPLVFIVDELDRCRPVYALQLLERIKHFFSVPNVHFVMGVHRGQLLNSVKVAYGADIDANLYLQKFIHLTVHVMDEGQHSSEWAATKFMQYVIRKLEFSDLHSEFVSNAAKFILHVVRCRDFSLRMIERTMTTLALALAFQGKCTFPAEIVAGLCILKVSDPQLFVKAKQGMLDLDDVRVKFGFHMTPEQDHRFAVEHGSKVWAYFTGIAIAPDESANLRRWFGDSSPRLLASVANHLVDRLHPSR